MDKKKIFLVIIVFIILIFLLSLTLVYSNESPAILYIENGSTKIERGTKIIEGQDGMALEVGDIVKTSEDGRATIVFYDGTILRLEPNTSIKIMKLKEDNISIYQLAGESWNKIEKIAGKGEYVISTPNTVATVRGTGFILTLEKVMVEEGKVEFKFKDTNERKIVSAGLKGLISPKDNKIILENLTSEEKMKLKLMLERDIKILKRVRMRIAQKDLGIRIMRKLANADNERLKRFFEEIDKGEVDIEEAWKTIPIKNKGARKVKAISERIKKYKMLLDKMNDEEAKNQ